MLRQIFLSLRIFFKTFLLKVQKFFLPDRFYTWEFVESKYKQNIGRYTYGHPIIIDWGDGAKIKIGNFTSIAGGTTFLLGGNHRSDWISTYPFPKKPNFWPEAKEIKDSSVSKGDVIVGNDVQFGHESMVLSGINIGDGSIIGARSVVTKDVEPYSVVAGNPARFIRKRFSDEQIRKLLIIKWWNWPIDKIRKNVSYLCSEDIEVFVSKFYKE